MAEGVLAPPLTSAVLLQAVCIILSRKAVRETLDSARDKKGPGARMSLVLPIQSPGKTSLRMQPHPAGRSKRAVWASSVGLPGLAAQLSAHRAPVATLARRGEGYCGEVRPPAS